MKKRVLIVAPHADDETLGCGGTIARLISEGHHVTVAVLTGAGPEEPNPIADPSSWDLVRKECRGACTILGCNPPQFYELPAVRIGELPLHVVNRICNEIVQDIRPTTIFIPFLYDLHRDHREIFNAFSIAWRPCTEYGRNIREIYAYETVSETHWGPGQLEPAFQPNTWIDISAYLTIKLNAIASYKSQIRDFPDARSVDGIRALAQWRGSTMGMAAAEAFILLRKLY